MPDRFGRDTSHLYDPTGVKPPEFAVDCLAAVEELFGKSWLEGDKGHLGHRLQILWKRKDWLATNELFGLGKTILELSTSHQKWLNSTARKIKSGIENSHGFITEILTCGSIRAKLGEVSPAPGNQKGYDFAVNFPSGFKYLISIKSQTMSQHETEFHRLGDELRSALSERANELGKCAGMILHSKSHIEPETFEFLTNFVRKTIKRYDRYTYKECEVRFFELDRSKESYASSMMSSSLLIYCPQHRNELKNAKDKLIKAGENMRAQLPRSDKYFRFLWIRVHSSTDVATLKKACKLMLEEHWHDYGFDAAIFLQPTVVRKGSNSIINTYFAPVMAELHQGFNSAVAEGRVGMLTIEAPVGDISLKPSELYLHSNQGRTIAPEGNYIYQKADYYHLLRQEGDAFVGEFSSPASGIRRHLVYKDKSGEVILRGPHVDVEETLII